ncbi:MAG: hypothetical protein ACN4GW_17480 [Desulforhopalus sp.]
MICLFTNPKAAISSLENAVYDETINILAELPQFSPQDLENSKQEIHALSYTQLRGLRAFSRLPDITGPEIKSLILELSETQLRFETVLLLDYFVSMPQATVELCKKLLDRLADVSFVTTRVVSSIPFMTGGDAISLLSLIDKVIGLDEPGAWAAKALFEQVSIPYAAFETGVEAIAVMPPNHQWAVEQFVRLKDMDTPTLLRGLKVIAKLSTSSAWNVRCLMIESPDLSSRAALVWIEDFFRFNAEEQDRWYSDLSVAERQLLLESYDSGSSELARKINNLHSVTDGFGREIGVDRLKGYSFHELEELYSGLHPRAREIWSQKMDSALQEKQRNSVVDLLYKATERARWEIANDLAAANIYILLAHGDRLYTSSFKNILVPLLKKRLDNYFDSDILSLITSADPNNTFSSMFVTSLAWKGSLTEFLPKTRSQQKRIVDLVAESAFKSDQSLMLFATTFKRFLNPLLPDARSHLVHLMLTHIEEGSRIISLQIRAILQFYLQTQPDLLSERDKDVITKMLSREGTLDFVPYQKTPFYEWTRDKLLSSLSVFHNDDDGRTSFLSNCRSLLKSGYSPEIAIYFSPEPLPRDVASGAKAIFDNITRDPESTLTELFRFAAKHPIVVDWKKTINGIQVSHTVTVYQTKEQQQRLLLLFFNNGYEMFAQRGHSYWRRHQLFSPLRALLTTGELSESQLQEKHRFLSLGSCGGMNAYLELGRIFSNQVDILATVGIGTSRINNPYNKRLLELIAANPTMQWDEIAEQMDEIFQAAEDEDYIQPGSLPAMLHKILYQTGQHHDTDQKS